MIVDEVEVAVGKEQPHGDLRIGCEERGDDRKNVQLTKEDRRSHRQFTSGRLEFSRSGAFRLLDLPKDAPCGSNIRHPGVGQCPAQQVLLTI